MPLAAIGAAALDVAVASLVFVGLAIFYRLSVGPSFIALPVLIVVQLALTTGIVLFLSALMVRFRDVRFVVPLFTQLWMYATPVIYPVALVPERWRPLYMLNPMATLVESYRAVILAGEWPPWGQLAAAGLLSCVVLVVAYRYFKRSESVFADVI